MTRQQYFTEMKICHTIEEIRRRIIDLREQGKSIGFVPTMGALHEGHLSLVRRSVEENDISVCSIFVNPIQFNNPSDLDKYPRTLEEDCLKLEETSCDIVFAPSVKEMYPEKAREEYSFGRLEEVMEGKHRPGHFNGVAVVVKRLFDICLPHRAYFGEKDFQQLAIIRALVEQEHLEVEIVGCPIIREADGLAMSSRNVRLSREERILAPEINKTLRWVAARAGRENLQETLAKARDKLNALPGMVVEYLEVADANSLEPIKNWYESENTRIFLAAFLGDVRLIDNQGIA